MVNYEFSNFSIVFNSTSNDVITPFAFEWCQSQHIAYNLEPFYLLRMAILILICGAIMYYVPTEKKNKIINASILATIVLVFSYLYIVLSRLP